jgi:hypothetical protein
MVPPRTTLIKFERPGHELCNSVDFCISLFCMCWFVEVKESIDTSLFDLQTIYYIFK